MTFDTTKAKFVDAIIAGNVDGKMLDYCREQADTLLKLNRTATAAGIDEMSFMRSVIGAVIGMQQSHGVPDAKLRKHVRAIEEAILGKDA